MPRSIRFQLLHRAVPVAIVLAIGFIFAGCSGEVKKAVENVKKAAESAASEVAAMRRPEKGQIEVSHNPPIKTDRVFGTFNVFPKGPSVLIIRSYENEVDAADEDSRTSSYPMVLIRAKTSSKSVSDLVGQKIPANVSIQYAGTFPAWSSEGDRPIEIEVLEGDEHYVKAKFTGVSLPEVGGNRKLACDGTVTALFPVVKQTEAAPAQGAPSDDSD